MGMKQLSQISRFLKEKREELLKKSAETLT